MGLLRHFCWGILYTYNYINYKKTDEEVVEAIQGEII